MWQFWLTLHTKCENSTRILSQDYRYFSFPFGIKHTQIEIERLRYFALVKLPRYYVIHSIVSLRLDFTQLSQKDLTWDDNIVHKDAHTSLPRYNIISRISYSHNFVDWSYQMSWTATLQHHLAKLSVTILIVYVEKYPQYRVVCLFFTSFFQQMTAVIVNLLNKAWLSSWNDILTFFFKKIFNKIQNCEKVWPYFESACKMHQNEYKQAYVWCSGSWDSLWYFHKQDIFLSIKHVIKSKKHYKFSAFHP